MTWVKAHPWIVGGSAVVVLIIGGVTYSRLRGDKGLSLLSVKQSDLSQMVTVTGKTVSQSTVDLAFQQSGTVVRVYHEVGDRVEAGESLAVLDQTDLSAQLDQAKASLKTQQAKLADLKSGGQGDFSVDPSRSASAQITAGNNLANLSNVLRDSYTKIDDAVHNYLDQVIANPNTPSPQLSFVYVSASGSMDLGTNLVPTNLALQISHERATVATMLDSWRAEINSPTTSLTALTAQADTDLSRLRQVRLLADDIAAALRYPASAVSDQTSRGVISTWQTNISTGRTSIETTISSLDSARRQYQSTYAGASAPQITAQEALVEQAVAGVELAQSQLRKTALATPIGGIVTKQEAKVGQLAISGTPVVSIIAPNRLQIEVNVSEVDIGKIDVGQPVHITLDAFPGEVFVGKVVYLDPAETTIDGAVNYKIKIAFDQVDARLKSGLTANLDILTKTKKGVIAIPQAAVIENDQGTFVKKMTNGQLVETKIKIGLRDQNGNVEVISGLQVGDQVQNIGLKPAS